MKVHYSDVSATQMFAIEIPTVSRVECILNLDADKKYLLAELLTFCSELFEGVIDVDVLADAGVNVAFP